MTEKKTFKNPRVTSYIDKVWVGWGEPYALDQGTTEFKKEEWDWEVTFTKKVKPIEVGKWYSTGKRGEEVCVYVLAIHGQMAWVSEDPDGLAGGALTAWTEQLDRFS